MKAIGPVAGIILVAALVIGGCSAHGRRGSRHSVPAEATLTVADASGRAVFARDARIGWATDRPGDTFVQVRSGQE